MPSSNPCRNHWGQLHSERKRGGGASAGGMAPPKPQTGSPRLPSARRSCSAYALGWGCHAVLRSPPWTSDTTPGGCKEAALPEEGLPLPCLLGGCTSVGRWQPSLGHAARREPSPRGHFPQTSSTDTAKAMLGATEAHIWVLGENPAGPSPRKEAWPLRQGPQSWARAPPSTPGPGPGAGLGPPTATMYAGHCTGGACRSPGHPAPVPSHSRHQVGAVQSKRLTGPLGHRPPHSPVSPRASEPASTPHSPVCGWGLSKLVQNSRRCERR